MQELTVKQKITNYYYFIVANSILLTLISIGYFFRDSTYGYLLVPNKNDWLAILYIITTHITHVVLYLFICSLLLLPTFFLVNKKRITIQLCLVITAITLAILDVLMLYLHKMHIDDIFISVYYNAIMEDLLPKIFSFRKISLVIVFLFLCLAECIVIIWLEKKNWPINNWFGKSYFVLIISCICITTVIYFNSDSTRKQNLIAFTQHLPWIVSGNKQIMNKISSTNRNKIFNNFTKFITNTNNKLIYPLKPLQAKYINKPPNILIIAIDAWRADCFNNKDSPNLWKFAQNGRIFYNHTSAANATYPGIFNLFYSVPATYWYSFLENKRLPILFDRLQQLNYQIGVFTPSRNSLPYFIKLEDLKDNYSKLEYTFNIASASKKDELATDNLLDWHEGIDTTKPWFAFIFYSSAHGNSFPVWYSKDYVPIKCSTNYIDIVNTCGKDYFINTYKLGVNYADHLASKILQQLKTSGDLTNTIVIITSDHGKEFNDTEQNQWGHATNFTDYQIKVPFAIVGPKVNTNELNWQQTDLTTNYDVVPTLMKNFLGVDNNPSDYSVGINLLGNRITRDWIVATGATSFSNYSFFCSIINKKYSIRWLPSGRHWFIDNMNKYLSKQVIDIDILDKALEQMTRFIKK